MHDFPRRLTFVELGGVAVGPFLYLYSLLRDSARERILDSQT
jgi:hypothetical protein